MKNKYLKRVTFLGENKMMVDGEHEVTIKPNSNKKFIFNGKNGKKGFSNEDELFDYVDEMTGTGGVGGTELPFATISMKNLKNRTSDPYNKVVTGLYTESEAIEIAEQMVKEALIKEFVVDNNFPAAKIVKSYKDANKKESEKSIKDVENGIKITYEKQLAAFPPNYYQSAKPNDYNGDGVYDFHKNAYDNFSLKYPNITDKAKEHFTKNVGDKELAAKMFKSAETKEKIFNQNNPLKGVVQMGKDIELGSVKTEKDLKSRPGTGVATMGFNLNENKMYKFTFKDEKYDFGKNRNQLAEAIPNKVKQDNTKFQMADSKGNVFMMEWSEGNATILEHRNLIAEQKLNEKVEKLFTYNNKERKNKPQRIDFDYFTKNKSED